MATKLKALPGNTVSLGHKESLKLLTKLGNTEAVAAANEAAALGLDWAQIFMFLITKGLPALLDWINKNKQAS